MDVAFVALGTDLTVSNISAQSANCREALRNKITFDRCRSWCRGWGWCGLVAASICVVVSLVAAIISVCVVIGLVAAIISIGVGLVAAIIIVGVVIGLVTAIISVCVVFGLIAASTCVVVGLVAASISVGLIIWIRSRAWHPDCDVIVRPHKVVNLGIRARAINGAIAISNWVTLTNVIVGNT